MDYKFVLSHPSCFTYRHFILKTSYLKVSPVLF